MESDRCEVICGAPMTLQGYGRELQSNFNGSNTFGTMKIFEPLRVYNRTRSGGIIGIPIFFNMKVYCMFSLESPQRGDSNKYTQYTISQY